MTESEWWNANGPDSLLDWLFFDTSSSERKLRLFIVACCRRVLHLTALAECVPLVDLTEAHIDGLTLFHAWRSSWGIASRQHREWHEDRDCEAWTNLPAFYARCAILEGTRTRWASGFPQWPGRKQEDPEMRCASQPCIASWYAERAMEATLMHPEEYERDFWDETKVEPAGNMRNRPQKPRTREQQAHVRLLHDIFGPLPFRDVAVAPEWLTSDVTALARGIYDEKAFDRMPILADALQDAGCENNEILCHCRSDWLEHVRGCWVLDLLLGRAWREPEIV